MSSQCIDIDGKLWRGGRIADHLSRLQHRRGHGVHSPYIYSIVRSVFMRRAQASADTETQNELISLGVKRRTAIELADLSLHCNFNGFSIDKLSCDQATLVTPHCNEEIATTALSSATSALVILEPYARRELCDKLLKEHNCTSIDRYSYLVLFNNHLPKHYFRL